MTAGVQPKARRLLPTRDAAAYLSVSPWQLRNLVHTGQIPVVQHAEGGRFLLDVRDLDAWIERNKRMKSEPTYTRHFYRSRVF